ncbi:carbohydrate kinase family protein [Salarchaeum japonicum]|uniref:carbohydrate kinase family protein n=1 Tax=Salarchaeum japonicum TaxID=555573 RepID=UPI003C763965
MPEVLVAGEALVDLVPDSPRPLPEVESFSRRAGGAPANVAVALSRLGHTPRFDTRVGADAFGRFLADTLDAEGVGDHVQRDAERDTALAVVSHAPGDDSFQFYRTDTADCHLDTARVPDRALDDASWLVVGGVMLSQEPGRTAIRDLVARARDRDCRVAFDPNGRPDLWDSKHERREVTDRLLSESDLVVTSPDDLPWLPDAEFADAVLSAGPSAVAVTRGDEGAGLLATDDSPWGDTAVDHPGFDAAVVDPTGAGDAFTAGLVAAILGERSARDAVAYANACGAAAVTARGAMPALPTRADAESFL